MKFKTAFLNEFFDRGFLYQSSNIEALDEYLYENKNAKAYIGFDATADSLHVGHLTQIFILRLFQKHGYTPIVLIGGGTTKIGDPSGRDKSRSMLSEEDIAKNIESIKNILSNFFEFDVPNKPIFVNNNDWLSSINFIDFLRTVGMHFSVNKMLNLESVSSRLSKEQNLTFLEFSYSLLQSYDFLTLFDKFACKVEFGGSDQWGNIVSGVELVRKLRNSEEVFGLTSPLLTTSDGRKMGKTASGAVWLRKDKFSSFDFWQYWRNTNDADVIRFLKLFTDLPIDQINELQKLEGKDINIAKKILANEITKICHGKDAAEEALKMAENVFETKKIEDNNVTLEMNFEDFIKKNYIDLFIETKMCASRSEVKNLIKGNGAYLNDSPIKDGNAPVSENDVIEGIVKISSGKKKISFIKINR